jgi:hypothetical protein
MKASVRRNSEYYSGAGRGVPVWEDRRKQLSGSDNTAGDAGLTAGVGMPRGLVVRMM